MAITNDVDQLNGVFRKRYANKVQYAVPDGVILIKEWPFASSDALGDDYNAPVSLTHENGFTFVAPGVTGSPAIKDPVASTTKNANVDSPGLFLQSEVNYEAASRAIKKGEAAIANVVRHVIKNNTESHKTMLEIQAFYGQSDLGVVESAVTGASGTITITPATWSPGAWAGREGMRVDVLDATLANKIDDSATVTSLDFVNRKITFDDVDSSVIAGHRLFVEDTVTAGATPTFAEGVGVHKALTETSTVFGIDTSAFSLWDAPSVAAGGQLDFDHTTEIAARIAEKGGVGMLTQLVSSLTFSDLIGDQAALRRYDEEGSTSNYRTGARAITFFTGNGEVSVRPSIYVKRGFSYVLNMRCWSRKGSQDFSFSSPFSTDAFHVFESKGGAFARSYSSVTPFCDALGQNGIITGIVNSSD